MEKLICTSCGGTINRETMICEFCGTRYKNSFDVIKIDTVVPGEHTLSASAILPNELIYTVGAQKASEIALKEITRKMAECIMPFISVRTMDDYPTNSKCINGRLRILEPRK